MIKYTKEEIDLSPELNNKIKLIKNYKKDIEVKKGNIIKLEPTNIAYIEPHILLINNIKILLFNGNKNFYINNLENSYKLNELEAFIKSKVWQI